LRQRAYTGSAGTIHAVAKVGPVLDLGEKARMTMSSTVAEPLTAADRCDRCGAQAYLRVTLENGGELLFCAHHAKAHSDKLRQVALKIHDETDKLN
jgi:hypothetical protein